jgi:hypothetical protein
MIPWEVISCDNQHSTKISLNYEKFEFYPLGLGTRGWAITHMDLGIGVEVQKMIILNIK